MNKKLHLPPGSTEAYAIGCNCQPRDGEEGYVNPDWPDWITARCPLHGPEVVMHRVGTTDSEKRRGSLG